MALPISATPTYNLTVPSTGKNVKYRPFLVKEEKALLIAQQSEDPVVMIDTIKSVIAACIAEIDVQTLATFDIEYIFAQIRAKSVGEIIDLIFYCDTCTDDKAKVQLSFDLTKLEVEKGEGHTNKIELFDDVGIVMKYPSIETLTELQGIDSSSVESIFSIIIDCIDYIYNSEEVYYAKEHSREELEQFLENMTSEQFGKVQKFFETMPKIRQEVDYNCPVCGKAHHTVLEGIQSFF